MNLYLVRHADAGDRDRWAGDDADRPLSELGHRQAHALGDAFRQQGLAVDAVACSPFVRARQTADGFLDGGPDGVATHGSDLLIPDGLRRRKLTRMVVGLGVENVVLIGHNPDLSAYLGWLIGADAETVTLGKGGAALVAFDGEPAKGAGRLAWAVTPGWFVPAEEPAGV